VSVHYRKEHSAFIEVENLLIICKGWASWTIRIEVKVKVVLVLNYLSTTS
jgi:hypothetical protein